jgi:O-antigen ligase
VAKFCGGNNTNIYSTLIMLYLLYTLFFTLPFERIPTLEVFGFTLKASYIVAVILVASFIIKKYHSITYSTSDYILVLFWLFGSITLLWSVNTQLGAIIILLWLLMFVLYFVVARALDDEKMREKVENIVLLSTTLVCLFGIYQFIGDSLGLSSSFTGIRYWYSKQIEILGFPRIQSVALEPLYFSNFLLVPLFVTIKRYLTCHPELAEGSHQKNGILHFVQNDIFANTYFWLLILILVNIILGVSRGAYLAIIITLAIMSIYFVANWKKYRELKLKLVSLAITIVISITISYLGIYALNGKSAASNFQGHVAVEDTERGTSVPGRVETYGRAWNYFKEKPIGGIGVGSFGSLNYFYDENHDKHYGAVNNIYLEILAETGAIGFICFALFIIIFLKELFFGYKLLDKRKKFETFMLFLGIIAIFIQYNFFSTLYIIYIWVFLGLLRSRVMK